MSPELTATSPYPSSVPVAKSSPSTSSLDGRKPRTLILCFDGTAEQYSSNNTNVVKFYSLLKKDDDEAQQRCWYNPGVGTYLNPGVVAPLFLWAAKMLDEAFAWYLDAHVRAGYQFLMQNYIAGDRICLFGFSRGAYTARALAGMLHKIGLLPKDNPEQIPFAYKLYKQTDKGSLDLAAGFKQTFCRKVEIEFVGVWETISSVGIVMKHTLPFTTSNTTIKRFRHALSLDEHRVGFLPNFYHRPTPEQEPFANEGSFSASQGASNEQQRREASKRYAASIKEAEPSRSWFGKPPHSAAKVAREELQQDRLKFARREGISPDYPTGEQLAEDALNNRIASGTDVLEVWFAGCHGDVGGGAVANTVEVSLSDITLRWMVREVVLAQCGITFDEASLLRANIPESIFRGTEFGLPAETTLTRNTHSHGFTVLDDAGPSSAEAVSVNAQNGAGSGDAAASSPLNGQRNDPLHCSADALSPIHDALRTTPVWWLLEIIPMSYTVQEPDGSWKTKWWIHLGRGRQVPEVTAPKFHVSVRHRMQDARLKYTPRAKYKPGTEVYVD
ncbi:hypothetical protein BD414DRAFT_501210 [Trametes punicea]|nr:hypothetical protein BD414DRAFT_501210 [Trametes punicea]